MSTAMHEGRSILAKSDHIVVAQTNAALGATIECGDIRDIDEETVASIRRTWLDNLVVVFRDQHLTNTDLVAFGRRFGDFQITRPLPNPLATQGKVKQGGRFDDFPQITVVSNVVENGVAAGGLGDGEVIWHTDMSSFEVTPNQTMLYAIETPPAGGRTAFCNMYLALDTLPGKLRERIEGLNLKHDNLVDAAGYVRKEYAEYADADIRTTPGAVHPLVRTHPETGNDCLYLGRRLKAYVVGLDIAESEALLDQLWADIDGTDFAWFHEWKPGDLVMWDNRCTMHYREPFDSNARRIMHRIVIQGSVPFYRGEPAREHPRGHLRKSSMSASA